MKISVIPSVGYIDYKKNPQLLLSDIILKYTGAEESLVTYLPKDAHNVVNKRPDIALARQEFGHEQKITLERGVPRTFDWLVKEYGLDVPRVRSDTEEQAIETSLAEA